MTACRKRDDRTFNGGMRDKNFFHRGTGVAYFGQTRGIVYKLTVGCGMKNGKSHVTETATLPRRDPHKHSELGVGGRGEGGVKEKRSGMRDRKMLGT